MKRIRRKYIKQSAKKRKRGQRTLLSIYNIQVELKYITLCFSLLSFRQCYKTAFVDEDLWQALSANLGQLLKKDVVTERGEEDQLIIERTLILARNILQVITGVIWLG